MPNEAYTLSKGILKIPFISTLLGKDLKAYSRFNKNVVDIICWGFKESAKAAKKLSVKKGYNLVRIEDGFITSLPVNDFKMSICIDYDGMHYSCNSRVHELIKRVKTGKELQRATEAIRFKNENFISKYNDTPVLTFNEMSYAHLRHVLIVDQVINDSSVTHSKGTEETFQQMILDALLDNPDAKILITLHPDYKKAETFAAKLEESWLDEVDKGGRVTFINTPINTMQLLKQLDAVYTISSLLGFEACLLDLCVTVYGSPFYAGYGLTKDKNCPVRGRETKESIFYAAYIDYCNYINPITKIACEIEDVLEITAQNISTFPESQLVVKKPSLWKRRFIQKFLKRSAIYNIAFSSKFYNVQWGYESDSPSILFIEDGFIRSKGLGTSLTTPSSLAIDRTGIYYDHQSNSDLQKLLNGRTFTRREIVRAKNLIKALAEHNITKYNIDTDERELIKKPYVLVAGQVEQDKSIKSSGNGYKNVDAVRIARERYKDHTIVYKPHPDVVHNNHNAQSENEACRLADCVVKKGDMSTLLTNAEYLVTITSNSGLEALIRGTKVYCLGYPYYYGWGLTENEISLPTRNRNLKLEELVSAALILYPTYYCSSENVYARAEDIVNKIICTPPPKKIKASYISRLAIKAKVCLSK